MLTHTDPLSPPFPTTLAVLQSIPLSKLGGLAELDQATLKAQLALLRQSTQVRGGALGGAGVGGGGGGRRSRVGIVAASGGGAGVTRPGIKSPSFA